MSCSVSVVARVERGGSWLGALVRSLDAQSLDVDAFEIIFLVADATLPVAARLRELCTRRPNIRVLPQPAESELAEQASGEWLLDLGSDLPERSPTLFPQALQRMLRFGDDAGCDVVLGRTVGDEAASTSNLLVTDVPAVDGRVDPDVARSALVLRRRADAATEGTVGVLGSYPCARVAQPSRGSTSTEVTDVSYGWRDGRVVISAAGTAQGLPADPSSAPAVLFSVRSPGTGSEYWLTGRGEVSPDGSFTGTAELDVRSAALGEPLPNGLWQLRVGVHGDATGWTSRATLPAGALNPGIVDGLPVAPGVAESGLALDVGGTRWSVVGPVPAPAVTVRETAHGSLMTARLDVAVSGVSRERGAVWLGDFDIPADLVADGTGARVECYLSGLPGSSPLATRFGGGKPVSTRLTVTASPTGIFTVAESRPDSTQARAKAARSSTQTAASMPLRGGAGAAPSPVRSAGPVRNQPASTSVASRLRRKVPARLEPLARSVSRSQLARRVYRRVAGLPERKS